MKCWIKWWIVTLFRQRQLFLTEILIWNGSFKIKTINYFYVIKYTIQKQKCFFPWFVLNDSIKKSVGPTSYRNQRNRLLQNKIHLICSNHLHIVRFMIHMYIKYNIRHTHKDISSTYIHPRPTLHCILYL